ncbi:chemotaxis protein CheW [Lysobacter auxotrophicus]|uniref:Chemotaxis protein CheW n=1 Tax=Lysobacter auxotrophicus TaxID=2992573 RepID=A0ABN6UNA1_9GAMM|nr:chemotaxis protein CheW [Lysobacter auxotrophicus]BDU17875.1 chemotaxis protein CheW [Lysobacter auxotrophicus]
MNHPALDAYLDELLDLTVDAVAPAPVAANAPVMAVADETAVAAPIDATALPETIESPDVEVPAPGDVPSPAIEMSSPVDAGLLAELDADPLFAAQAPAAAVEPPAADPIASIDPGLLAELASDPLFAGQFAAPADLAPATPQIDPGLLAELDSDPLFAAAMAAPAAPALQIDPGLLAELDSDPLFAAAMAAPAAPVAPKPAPTPAPAHRPAPRAPMPHPDARSGLRPVELTPPALPPSVTTTHRWLRVAVGEDSYAVELLRVQEVGRTVPIVAMRGAAPSVLGAMNLRGRIVPVFDLGLWLGTGRVVPDERARIVVVERDNELIGALVSAVDDVVTLGPDRIEPPLMAAPSRAIVGVARVVAKPTVLLDANALFG